MRPFSSDASPKSSSGPPAAFLQPTAAPIVLRNLLCEANLPWSTLAASTYAPVFSAPPQLPVHTYGRLRLEWLTPAPRSFSQIATP